MTSISRTKKMTLILLLLALPLFTFSQHQIFKLKNQKYYSERNKFLKDSIWRFNQIIEYNEPYVSDEESWIRLTLEIKDTSRFMNIKKLDVSTDTAILVCHFVTFTVWSIYPDASSVSGKVTFVSEKPGGITLRLDLIATNVKTQGTYIYEGERIFSRTINMQDFYY